MKNSNRTFVALIALHILSFVMAMIFILLSFTEYDFLLGLVFTLWTFNVVFSFFDTKKRQTFLIFNITFFVFLLGRLFVNFIFGEKVLPTYPSNVRLFVFIGLSIALFFTYLGQLIGEQVKKKARKRINLEFKFLDSSLSSLLLILFYLTYPFNFLYMLDKAVYVVGTSYLSLYTTFISSIPYIFIKIGELNQIIFILLFCAETKKNHLYIPLVLYLITTTISLATGQRNAFVLNLIVVFLLIQIINNKLKGRNGTYFVSPKLLKYLLFIGVPLLIVLLEFVGNLRSSNLESSSNVLIGFSDFFEKQGGQIDFFADTFAYKDQIWKQDVPYTFSSIYNYLRNLFGLINFGTYTKENALYGNSLGATQFYISSPGSLLSGKGAGCCYLSELYFDFGFFGIVFGSVFIGVVLSLLTIKKTNSFIKNAFIVLIIRHIVYIPRASFFDWISYPFNVWNLALVLGVVILANSFKKQSRTLLKI